MKKLKVIIIIFSIIIIIMIGTIILLKKTNTQTPQEIENTEEIVTHANEIEEIEEKTDRVKDSEKFFTVSSCVSQYLDFLNKKYDIYYGYDENNNYTQIVNPYDNIIEVLSETYKKQNNITKDNLKNDIELLEDKVTFLPLQMRMIENENIEKYLVYGMIENTDNKYIDDIYVFVNLDEKNSTFSIEPIKKQYDNIEDITYTNEENSIEQNGLNEYIPAKVSSEFMCQQYFNLYKSVALAKPEMAYQFLEEEYRQKRFGEVSSYIKYLNDNKEELEALQLTQYLVNGQDNYLEYVCKDKYENLYIFNEKAIMDFTMKLDTYTIPTDKFKQTYRSTNVKQKVMMNIDKWVQMLNNRDYTSAYQVLNETFRNNNFGSVEKFEAYMREKYSLHYKIEFSNFSEEGNTYVQHVILTDITGTSNEQKELDVIMKLEEETDFVMSFNIE